MRKLVAILALMLVTASWSEGMSLKDYLIMRNSGDIASKNFITNYVGGIGQGLSWANATVEQKYNSKLFCQPEELLLYPNNHVSILDKAIEKYKDMDFVKNIINRYQDTDILGMLLLLGLEETFPCEKK